MFFLPFWHRLGWVSVIYFLYIFLCTSSSISKWYRKDINISYSCFSRISLLHERVIWVGLPEYIRRCFCNEWWGSSGFKQALILWYITFFLLINGLLSDVFREGCGCILWRLRLVSFSMREKVKDPGNGRMANRYMFRGLAVSIHGPAHRQFEKLMDALSTWENDKLQQHLSQQCSPI